MTRYCCADRQFKILGPEVNENPRTKSSRLQIHSYLSKMNDVLDGGSGWSVRNVHGKSGGVELLRIIAADDEQKIRTEYARLP